MIVIKPVEINDTTLTSSSIPEPDSARGEVEYYPRSYHIPITQDIERFDYHAESGLIYGSSFRNSTIYVLNKDFKETGASFSTAAQGLEIGDMCFIGDVLYVVFYDQYNIAKYNLDGSFIGTQGISNANGVPPTGIATDGFYLYIAYEDYGSLKKSRYDGYTVEPFDIPLTNKQYIAGLASSEGSVFLLDRRTSETYMSEIDTVEAVELSAVKISSTVGENGILKISDAIYINKLPVVMVQYNLLGRPAYGYPSGFDVIVKSSHKKYTSSFLSKDRPEIGVNKPVPSWIETGVSNRYNSFDELISTQSVSDLTKVIEITTGEIIGGIAGLNITGASSINVTMTDPTDGVVYNKDVDLVDNSNIVNWSNYLWEPISSRNYFALLDLPAYLAATITITFTGSGEIGVGALIVGPRIELGITDYDGTSIQELDFSAWSEDEFGNLKITKRPSAKLVNYGVKFNESQLNYVGRQLNELSGIPAVYVGADGDVFDYTLTYGIKRDSEIDVQPVWCSVPIQVRGLI